MCINDLLHHWSAGASTALLKHSGPFVAMTASCSSAASTLELAAAHERWFSGSSLLTLARAHLHALEVVLGDLRNLSCVICGRLLPSRLPLILLQGALLRTTRPVQDMSQSST
jgi:hypothetical protein